MLLSLVLLVMVRKIKFPLKGEFPFFGKGKFNVPSHRGNASRWPGKLRGNASCRTVFFLFLVLNLLAICSCPSHVESHSANFWDFPWIRIQQNIQCPPSYNALSHGSFKQKHHHHQHFTSTHPTLYHFKNKLWWSSQSYTCSIRPMTWIPLRVQPLCDKVISFCQILYSIWWIN